MSQKSQTDSILPHLCRTVAQTLHISDSRINRDTLRESIEEWDSLKNIEVMLSVESEFNIRFETREWMSCEGISAIHRILIDRTR